jgi:hypothetical protein
MEQNTFIIEIHSQSDGGGNASGGADSAASSASDGAALNLNSILHPVSSLYKNALSNARDEKNVWKYYGLQIGSQIASDALNAAENAMNRYTSLEEDYVTEQTYNNVLTTVGKVKSGIGSVAAGVISGAAFGPAGMVLGAVTGMASFAYNEYIGYQKRMSSYYQALNATDFQTQFDSSRLGLIDNGRGTQN